MVSRQSARIALIAVLGVLILVLPAGLAGCGKKRKPVYHHGRDRGPSRVYRRDVRRRPPVYYQAPARRPRHDDRRGDRRDGRDHRYDRDRGGDRDYRGDGDDRDRRQDHKRGEDRGHQRYEKQRRD